MDPDIYTRWLDVRASVMARAATGGWSHSLSDPAAFHDCLRIIAADPLVRSSVSLHHSCASDGSYTAAEVYESECSVSTSDSECDYDSRNESVSEQGSECESPVTPPPARLAAFDPVPFDSNSDTEITEAGAAHQQLPVELAENSEIAWGLFELEPPSLRASPMPRSPRRRDHRQTPGAVSQSDESVRQGHGRHRRCASRDGGGETEPGSVVSAAAVIATVTQTEFEPVAKPPVLLEDNQELQLELLQPGAAVVDDGPEHEQSVETRRTPRSIDRTLALTAQKEEDDDSQHPVHSPSDVRWEHDVSAHERDAAPCQLIGPHSPLSVSASVPKSVSVASTSPVSPACSDTSPLLLRQPEHAVRRRRVLCSSSSESETPPPSASRPPLRSLANLPLLTPATRNRRARPQLETPAELKARIRRCRDQLVQRSTTDNRHEASDGGLADEDSGNDDGREPEDSDSASGSGHGSDWENFTAVEVRSERAASKASTSAASNASDVETEADPCLSPVRTQRVLPSVWCASQAPAASLQSRARVTAANRESLAHRWFDYFNTTAFDSTLPAIELQWTSTLRSTAGLCECRRGVREDSRAIDGRLAVIALSVKVLDEECKLATTLVHEMCHAAAFLVDNQPRPPHGLAFQRWARRAEARCPGLSVSVCHSYTIYHRWRWQCVNDDCGRIIGRDKNSRTMTERQCKCGGSLRALGAFDRDDTPIRPRQVTGFAAYVQQHYSAVKTQADASSHAAVMSALSQSWSRLKLDLS